jgi:hypothetical protein
MSEDKSNTQLLKEMQDTVAEIEKRKAEVVALLDIIDELEIKYYKTAETIKSKSKNG